MTPQQTEALKLALEALENLFGIPDKWTSEGGGDVAVWRLGGSYRAQQAITAIKEAQKEHAMREVQRLGQEIEQELKIKTTDPFDSSRVGDYNRGWNDCLFASGVVKQTEQEPVAWLSTDSIGERYLCFDKPLDNDPVQPLYATPPQRTWVGLTDEQIDTIGDKVANEKLVGAVPNFRVRFARAIEAKLKENT